MPAFSLFPEGGVDTRRCASKDAGPQRGVFLGAVPHRLEEGNSASEDAGPRRGGGLCCPTLVGEENKSPFIRVWKPFPSRRVLKP